MLRERRPRGLSLIGLLILSAGCAPHCYLKKTEQVDFYPSYTYQQADGQWALPVTAWVHQSQPDASIQRGISRVVTLTALFPGAAEEAVNLQQRVTPFLLHGEPQKNVPIQLEGRTVKLEQSDEDGFIHQDVTLPSISADAHTAPWLAFKTQACRDDSREFKGQAIVIAPTGTSIISDLDGLMSGSSSGPDSGGLAVTRHLQADPAMPPVYQKWQAQGAVFHYFSASPWQLFGPLSNALASQGFPQGILHLKTLEINSLSHSIDAFIANMAVIFGSSITTKFPAMEMVLQRFPGRHFILVGDTRQQDQAPFAALARKYPNQIAGIYIRNNGPDSDAAVTRTFAGISTKVWRIFRDPAELGSATF